MQTTKESKGTTPSPIKTKKKLQLDKKHGKQPTIGYTHSSPISKLNTLMHKSRYLKGKYSYTKFVYHVYFVPKSYQTFLSI